MQFAQGDTYEGNWENDLMSGKGVYINSNGDKYSGNFKHGVKQQYGVMEYQNKDKYEGEWKDDMIWGSNGQFWFANGNHYVGHI